MEHLCLERLKQKKTKIQKAVIIWHDHFKKKYRIKAVIYPSIESIFNAINEVIAKNSIIQTKNFTPKFN